MTSSIVDGSAAAVSPVSSSITAAHASVAKSVSTPPVVYPCPDYRPHSFYLHNSQVVLPGYTGRVWITHARNAEAIWNALWIKFFIIDSLPGAEVIEISQSHSANGITLLVFHNKIARRAGD